MSSESCQVSLSISSKNARASEEDTISRLISRASRAWYLTISPRLQASVVQKMDSAIHRINLKPVDCAIGLLLLIRWIVIYPVDIHVVLSNFWTTGARSRACSQAILVISFHLIGGALLSLSSLTLASIAADVDLDEILSSSIIALVCLFRFLRVPVETPAFGQHTWWWTHLYVFWRTACFSFL